MGYEQKAALINKCCGFYGYIPVLITEKGVIIKCPKLKGLNKTRKASVQRFSSIENALGWFFEIMRETNRKCRQYNEEPAWSYADILSAYNGAGLRRVNI